MRQPTFPLKAPGTAVIHAGPQQNPRIVSVPTRCTEHVLELRGHGPLSRAERSLTDFSVSGIMAEFVSGRSAIPTMSIPPTVRTPSTPCRSPRHLSNLTELRHASATIGFREDTPFCHIHASWTAADGDTRGGHLLPGTLAGPSGLTIRLFALPDARLLSEVDPETGFSAFAPTPTSSETPASPDAVVSRVRPGEILDEAALDICRNAGFESAEVSRVSAVRPEPCHRWQRPWPAVEFTHLSGAVTGANSTPRITLSGEVADVAGEVSPPPKPQANPVAVTFELFVRCTD